MKPGDRVRWRSVNKEYTGVVEGYHGTFAVVRIDGTGRIILLENNNKYTKK